jgi:hypothetical protein
MNFTCQELQSTYPDCTACSCGKEIVVAEKGKKYILNNLSRRQVCKIRIDQCVYKSQTDRKCDYSIIVCEPANTSETLYFIELKGNKFLDAVDQLIETLDYFRPQITGNVFARAVLSKVCNPRAIETDPKVLKLKRILKKYNGNFEYGSVQYNKDRI